MKKPIQLDLDYNYLQEIRLAHSIMESDYELLIKPQDEIKFILLKEKFGAQYGILTKDSESVLIKDIFIQHTGPAPETRLGPISRPLIWPDSIIDYCRSLWPVERKVKYAFIGLVTPARKKWLNFFLSQHVRGYQPLTNALKVNIRLYDFLSIFKSNPDKILATASTRGRNFPGKTWDDEYFRLQSSAQFILCPSGDAGCPWTYRFFEAIFCGAIPIVETDSPAYSIFKYYKTQETTKFIYDKEMVEFNFSQAKKYLTVSKDEITRAIDELIRKQNS